MKNNWTYVLIAGVSGGGLGWGAEALALTSEQRFERLERHIEELERRLEISERENARLRSERSESTRSAAQPDLKTLDQKVKILERKQEVEKEIAAENAKKTPKLEAGPNGFRFSSPEGDHVVNLRGSVQADGKFFMDDNAPPSTTNPSNLVDRFELKQARIRLEGTLFKYFDFKIMPEFGGGSVRLFDAYLDARYFPYANLSVGKQKTPISLERLQGDNDFALLERAYPTYLASNRDVGVMLHGQFAKPGYQLENGGPVDFKNLISYQLGIFNGDGDNGAGSNTDSDDDKEFTGRLWAHPFQHSGIAFLEGFGLGVGGTWEQPKRKGLANLPSPNGQNTIVNYSNLGTGTASLFANGDHYRIYPQAYWYYGPYGLLGEYVVSSQQLLGIQASGQSSRLQQYNTAWQVQASYVLTGEDNTFQSVKPRRNFDPLNGSWGAFQLAARWTELDIDDDTFANQGTASSPFILIDPAKSVSKASTWTLGANWFLNRYTRIMADYEQTYFDGGAANKKDRQMEKVFSTRFQLSF
jgi:phosphate-selective porin OprO/OprP